MTKQIDVSARDFVLALAEKAGVRGGTGASPWPGIYMVWARPLEGESVCYVVLDADRLTDEQELTRAFEKCVAGLSGPFIETKET